VDQHELFNQFNAEIEKSFAEQQQYLDEIFRQNAKKIIDIQA
jgi:ribosomal protein S17E